MILYITGVCYSWFAHQLQRHGAQLERRNATLSSVPEPPAGPPCCLCRQRVGASAAFPCKLPG